jgi:site-specific DNA-methyltransferase (adenine-specific)
LSWKLFEGDCLEIMPLEIEDKSIDMILCDLPYGTTACKWDSIITLEPLWNEYKRIIKDNGAIVLTSMQPFTSTLISSNYDMFKYCWIWDKKKPTGHLNAKKQPLRVHEDICLFYKSQVNYNPQFKDREEIRIDKPRDKVYDNKGNQVYGKHGANGGTYNFFYPKSIIQISNANQNNKMHPTQKPVKLFEYLIKTYTNENDLILDNCAGSGTTGVASYNLNRNCIMIEKEAEYCDIIKKRMAELTAQPTLNLF